jgi:hypothetical protein
MASSPGGMVRSHAHERMVAGQSGRLEAAISEIKIFRNGSIVAKSDAGASAGFDAAF